MLDQYYNLLNIAINISAVVIFISSADDLFIDMCYWVRRCYRALFKRKKHKPITIDNLRSKPEQNIAIMIPAWQEHSVIAQMLESNLTFIAYENYTMFVGVYQNDPETIAEVDRMMGRYPQIQKVVVPHGGPTCKADCLNWVIQAIFLYEKKRNIDFSMIVMHDSEDIIHPLELLMFNYLVPRKDLIQIPVRCLETRLRDVIRGTYIDEFSEYHNKDMVVREALSGVIPSAGVASCFSKKAILALCEDNENQPFNTNTLTEDYDISYRLAQRGDMNQIFVTFPVSVGLTKNLYPNSHAKKLNKEIPIAVAEYFPNKFFQSIRQKTRWNIGIFFQAASMATWKGSFFNKYYFFHDRKGIITNIVSVPVYLLVINTLIIYIGAKLLNWPNLYLTVPVWIIIANSFLLLNRIIQRMYFTAYQYNWKHGLVSVLRIVVSNIINFFSTCRAIYFFARHLITGKMITWDKTDHEYPSLEILENRYKRLGELLLEKKMLNKRQLDILLDEQKTCNVSLGRLLVSKGFLTEEQLLAALSSQSGYARGDVTKIDFGHAKELLDREFILEHEIFPVSVSDNKVLTLLTTKPMQDTAKDAVLSKGYSAINPRIILNSEMDRLLSQFRREVCGTKRLGDILIENGIVPAEMLEELLAEQRIRHVTLGALLLEKDIISQNNLLRLLSTQLNSEAGSADDAMSWREASEALDYNIIINHRIYPVYANAAERKISVLTDTELSAQAKSVLEQNNYSEISTFLILEHDMNKLISGLKEYLGDRIFSLRLPERSKLGGILVSQNIISCSQLDETLREQQEQNTALGEMLVQKGFITKEKLENILREHYVNAK